MLRTKLRRFVDLFAFRLCRRCDGSLLSRIFDLHGYTEGQDFMRGKHDAYLDFAGRRCASGCLPIGYETATVSGKDGKSHQCPSGNRQQRVLRRRSERLLIFTRRPFNLAALPCASSRIAAWRRHVRMIPNVELDLTKSRPPSTLACPLERSNAKGSHLRFGHARW